MEEEGEKYWKEQDKKAKKTIDVSNINGTVIIDRFDEKFYNTTEADLQKLKNK